MLVYIGFEAGRAALNEYRRVYDENADDVSRNQLTASTEEFYLLIRQRFRVLHLLEGHAR
jgi:hypothetical protein